MDSNSNDPDEVDITLTPAVSPTLMVNTSTTSKKVVTGLKVKQLTKKINESVDDSQAIGFNFICLNLMGDDKMQELMDVTKDFETTSAFTWSDLNLTMEEWTRGVIGVLSNFQKYLMPGQSDEISSRCLLILERQVKYAHHLRLPAIMLELKNDFVISYASALNQFFNRSPQRMFNNYWIKLPMASSNRSIDENWDADEVVLDPWNTWNTFRTLCDDDQGLYLILELKENTPTQEECDRWFGEPIKALSISTDVFMTNRDGFPVLSKAHQKIVLYFFRLKINIYIECEEMFDRLDLYYKYIQHLRNQLGTIVNSPGPSRTDSLVSGYATGYENILQVPLQPLKDNLESQTYEIFEKDPVKYILYEEAIHQALLTISGGSNENEKLILMVAGAGRGPLVVRCLLAAARAKKLVHVYAIEKNVNACNTLFHLKTDYWGDKVTVIFGDVRKVNLPTKVHLIVSELLGSFGDNECSPECLDGAQRLLEEGGIMIPSSYTSYISPIMAAKAYRDLKLDLSIAPSGRRSAEENHYVVLMTNKYCIAPPKELFTFTHPNLNMKPNFRYQENSFIASMDCTIHGFIGYFTAVLFNNITLSIHPDTYSTNMVSWFPIYTPISTPVYVKAGETIVSHFWRKCSDSAMWYEWTISSPITMPIHNPGGRTSQMGL